MTRDEIISRLDIPAITRELIPSLKVIGDELQCCCPWGEKHEGGYDKNPSLTMNSKTGAFLCHACGVKGGLPDLVCRVKVITLPDAFKWLESKAGAQQRVKQVETGRFHYHNADGSKAYYKIRLEPGRDGKDKEFFFRYGNNQTGRGGVSLPYNLHLLKDATSILVTEGERHADFLLTWGLTATTLDSGADSKPTEALIEVMTGKRIAILEDNDVPGRRYAGRIASALFGKAESIRVVNLPGLQSKGDILDWKEIEGNDKARLLEIIKSTPEWEQTPTVPADDVTLPFDLSRLTLGSDIADGNFSTTFLVDKLIPEYSITLFYAKGGSGKSTVSTQIATAVISGKPFMGLNTIERPVVIIDYENPNAVVKERINAIDGSRVIYFWLGKDNPPQLDKQEWKELKALVSTLKNPLIIIDTLSSSCSGLNILENGHFSPIMHKIVELRNIGCTIILLHHTPKQDETKYIGASTIYNNCDHILAMYPVKTPDSQKETTDEDDAKIYRLGTKDKTRFGHFAMYIEFDEDKRVFVQAADPDKEAIDRILKIIEEQAPVNQTTIINQIGAYISKGKLTKLLKRNEGLFWTVEPGANNAKIYKPFRLSGFSPLYRQETGKPESGFSIPPGKPDTTDSPQPPLNNGFAGFLEGNGEPGNVPFFDENDFDN